MLLKTNIPFSYVFGKVKVELLIILLYASLIALLYNSYHFTRITIPIAVPAILGTVISLLLGFRSNQAYDRWWEARHIWGAIVNDSRTLARQVMNFTHDSFDNDSIMSFQDRIIRRQIAWTYSLGHHLRGQSSDRVLEKYLNKQDLQYAQSVDNAPSALLDLMGRDLKTGLEEGWINRFQQVEIDRTLSRLCDSMGKCERIKNTVFPITYSLYIHLALLLFIALLPFGVIEYFGLFEVPLVVAISASFLLIEKMAIHLQDPFENKPTDTPMTHIASSIEKNLLQLYGLETAKKNWSEKEWLAEKAAEDSIQGYAVKKEFYVL
ncbi:MAG: bestrophin family ion channel [Ferruginibacter sp.]|nr:bestrophin family ion channel [Ferruginibacter sp.]